ncbi:MAG TPA: hypothetical protein DCQ31_11455 [Bacteroidales bacterium]|nr:hypothetical protein [Bacteroidales bacterium]
MKDTFKIDEFITRFGAIPEFVTADIVGFYAEFEPLITKQAVSKRIEKLVKTGVLKKTGRGTYTLGTQSDYSPVPDRLLVKLNKKLRTKYSQVQFCLWNTKQLNEFMLHQPGRFYALVETEPDMVEYVFNYLSGFNKNVFDSADTKTIEKYAAGLFNCIIIKPLVTEAPIKEINKIRTAELEKILVDIFCDTELYVAQQGYEMLTIYQTAFEKYTLSLSKLLRYAARRGKRNQLTEFLEEIEITKKIDL